MKSDTQELFLTFKLLKRRYRSTELSDKLRRLDYFNHPFEAGSEIKLVDDFDLPKPVSLESLATQFVAVEDKRGTKNAIEREGTGKKKKEESFNEDTEFEPFNFENSTNF